MRYTTLILTGSLLHTLQAQSLERHVLGSAGSYFYQASAGSLSWTAGEAATAT